jgi:hypothetical protein
MTVHGGEWRHSAMILVQIFITPPLIFIMTVSITILRDPFTERPWFSRTASSFHRVPLAFDKGSTNVSLEH